MTPEESLVYQIKDLESRIRTKQEEIKWLRAEQTDRMRTLKSWGLTFKEVGDILGITGAAVFERFRVKRKPRAK